MSKNIAISDDVYRELKKEKGDRSFSDVIREQLDDNRKIADVAGTGILDDETMDAVTEEIERTSEGTLDRIEDETL